MKQLCVLTHGQAPLLRRARYAWSGLGLNLRTPESQLGTIINASFLDLRLRQLSAKKTRSFASYVVTVDKRACCSALAPGSDDSVRGEIG